MTTAAAENGREKVLEKIRKLMSLAGDARGNVNETAAAAEAAQRLMFQFKVDMSELEVEMEAAEPITDVDLLQVLGQKSTMGWQTVLANAIARANFCRCLITPWSKYRPSKLQIFGKPGDVQATSYLFRVVVNQIHDLCKRYAAEQKTVWGSVPSGATNSFRLGAANAISQRVGAARRQQEAALREAVREAANSTALARVKSADSEIDSWMKDTFRNTKTYNVSKPSTVNGYYEGVAAGKTVALSGGRNALKTGTAALSGSQSHG